MSDDFSSYKNIRCIINFRFAIVIPISFNNIGTILQGMTGWQLRTYDTVVTEHRCKIKRLGTRFVFTVACLRLLLHRGIIIVDNERI